MKTHTLEAGQFVDFILKHEDDVNCENTIFSTTALTQRRWVRITWSNEYFFRVYWQLLKLQLPMQRSYLQQRSSSSCIIIVIVIVIIIIIIYLFIYLPWQSCIFSDASSPNVVVPSGHEMQEIWASWSWYWSTAHARQLDPLKKWPRGQLTGWKKKEQKSFIPFIVLGYNYNWATFLASSFLGRQ